MRYTHYLQCRACAGCGICRAAFGHFLLRRCFFKLWEFDRQALRPSGGRLCTHVAIACQASLDIRGELMGNFFGYFQFDPIDQLVPFNAGFDIFRRELCLCRHEGNLGGERVVGQGIQDDAGVISYFQSSDDRSGQKYCHMNI